jgi:hypothetical protein
VTPTGTIQTWVEVMIARVHAPETQYSSVPQLVPLGRFEKLVIETAG